jgi:hypothetical protein
MANSIDLRSTAFLDTALDSLNRVGWQLGNNSQAASEIFRHAVSRLSLIGEARLDDLRDAQLELDSVDEEESGSHERERRDEALAAVQHYRRIHSQVESAGRSFIAQAEALSHRGKHLSSAGIATLQRRIEARDDYLAIQVPDASGSSVSAGNKSAAHSNQASAKNTTPSDNIPPSALPTGFGWINIDEVDASDLIDDPAEFKKVEYSNMIRGMEILRDEIIPALRRGTFTREDAEQADREGGTEYTAEGWVHPESRLTIWYAFLDPRREADVVAVERGLDGKLLVSSGRHRLGLARKLGIQTVPVRIIGKNNVH